MHTHSKMPILIISLLVTVACSFSLLYSSTSYAHSALAVTIPAHEAQLNSSPKQLRFLFKAEVTITNIRIDILDHNNIDTVLGQIEPELPRNSLGQSTAFGIRVDIDIPELSPADYRVVWRAMSQDGHYVVDDFDFSVIAQ